MSWDRTMKCTSATPKTSTTSWNPVLKHIWNAMPSLDACVPKFQGKDTSKSVRSAMLAGCTFDRCAWTTDASETMLVQVKLKSLMSYPTTSIATPLWGSETHNGRMKLQNVHSLWRPDMNLYKVCTNSKNLAKFLHDSFWVIKAYVCGGKHRNCMTLS